jgi:hypothetical protein
VNDLQDKAYIIIQDYIAHTTTDNGIEGLVPMPHVIPDAVKQRVLNDYKRLMEQKTMNTKSRFNSLRSIFADCRIHLEGWVFGDAFKNDFMQSPFYLAMLVEIEMDGVPHFQMMKKILNSDCAATSSDPILLLSMDPEQVADAPVGTITRTCTRHIIMYCFQPQLHNQAFAPVPPSYDPIVIV